MSKKSKNKGKPQGQNLPLKDRLAKHWAGEKWEAFVSLYLRDREASERTAWAGRIADGLYNCMTRALFVDRSMGNAEAAAVQLLAEKNLPDDLGCCAEITLRCAAIDMGRAAPSVPIEYDGPLPTAYDRLRREINATPTVGDDVRALVEKLDKQFKSLEGARNITPYTNFLKTLKELERRAPSPVFRTLGAVAELLKDVNRATSSKDIPRNISAIVRSKAFAGIAPNQSEPLVLGLWDILCESGGRKLGREWENSARAIEISFAAGFEKYRPLYEKMKSLEKSRTQLPIQLALDSWKWTDCERYILAYAAILALTDDDFFEEGCVELNRFMDLIKILTDIGRRWRPQNPWAKPVATVFSNVVRRRGEAVINMLDDRNPPFEAMLTADILYFVIHKPAILKDSKSPLWQLVPFNIPEDELSDISQMLTACDVSPEELLSLKRLLSEETYAEMLAAWVRFMVWDSTDCALYRPFSHEVCWARLKNGHFRLIVGSVPPDRIEAAFCALFADQKPFRISPDKDLREKFLNSAKNENTDATADILEFLLTLRDVDNEFLISLFEASLPSLIKSDEWERLTETLNEVNENKSPYRVAIASEIHKRLKKIPARERSDALKRAVRNLGMIAGGKRAEKIYYDDMSELEMMENFFEEMNPFRGKRGWEKREEKQSSGFVPPKNRTLFDDDDLL